MIKHSLRLLASLVLIIAAAAPARADETAKLKQLFEVTRFEEVFATFPDIIGHEFAQLSEDQFADADMAVIGRLTDKFFSAAALERDMLQVMAGKVPAEDLDRLLSFFRSDLGQQMVAHEVAASQPGVEAIIEAEGARLYRGMLESGDPRLALIDRMVEAMKAVDFLQTMSMNIYYALMSGMMGAPGMPNAMSDEEIIEMVNAQVADSREMLALSIKSDFAFTYREVSIEDLEAYTVLYETKAARTFNAQFLRAFQTVLLPRTRAFGHELMVHLGARKT